MPPYTTMPYQIQPPTGMGRPYQVPPPPEAMPMPFGGGGGGATFPGGLPGGGPGVAGGGPAGPGNAFTPMGGGGATTPPGAIPGGGPTTVNRPGGGGTSTTPGGPGGNPWEAQRRLAKRRGLRKFTNEAPGQIPYQPMPYQM